MKHVFKRPLAIALALLLTFTLALPALAATNQKMIVTSSTAVRSEPIQKDSNVLATLKKNDIVTQTGTSGLWAILSYNGQTAYALSSHLKLYSTSSSSAPVRIYEPEGRPATSETMYATGTVNVRKGPGTNYAKIGQLDKNDSVSKVGVSGNWAIINWNDGVAYVSLTYLGGSSSGSSGSGSTSDNIVQATSNVNVRSGPGTNYSVIGWLSKGSTVSKLGTSGNWTKVTYDGITAYVSSAYLTAYRGSSGSSGSSSGSSQPYSGVYLYARVDTTVRLGPSSSNSAIGYLEPGQTVRYIDSYGAWYRIAFGSYSSAYVYGPDMRVAGSDSSIITTTGYVYASGTVRVYQHADTNSRVLGYLYAGDTATRTGTVDSTWTRIDFNGATGYVITLQVSSYYSGTGLGDTSRMGYWMYSRYNNAACYIAPTSSSSYLDGYLSKGEAVWAIEGNSNWTKITVGSRTLYTASSNLTTSSSGSYYDNYYPHNNHYNVSGDGMIRYDSTQLYVNTSLTTKYQVGGTDVKLNAGEIVRVLYDYNWMTDCVGISWNNTTVYIPRNSIRIY